MTWNAPAAIAMGSVVVIAGIGGYIASTNNEPAIRTFGGCELAGYAVMESYPRKCRTSNGQLFVENTKTKDEGVICRDFCGDRVCAEIVCLGGDCPCSENYTTCPEDCSKPTGDSGICVDQCGNGTCEEVVCQGSGCPCSETAGSCPSDCSKT